MCSDGAIFALLVTHPQPVTMSDISLRNFEDLLDPDVLDVGLDFFKKGSLKKMERTSEFASAAFDFKNSPCEIGLELSGSRVTAVECSCGDFDENWEESPCVHFTAMLYALKSSEAPEMPEAKRPGRPKAEPGVPATPKTGSKPASQNKKEQAPKKVAKPKDPAEALLGELEPREIFEFVRQMVLKNKDFKSQFLLHFSDKTAGSAQQFDDILTNAIAAVRGRRKYLKGADGAKISSVLSPLAKQAASAESKGYFREAFAICKSFLRHLPAVFASLETPSAKLDALMLQSLNVISLIINNKTTPFDFRNEVFEALLKEYETLEKGYSGSIKHEVYVCLLNSARTTKRLDDLAKTLRDLVDFYKAKNIQNYWEPAYYAKTDAIERLIQLYEKEIQDEAKAMAELERNKDQIEFYLRLIEKKTAANDLDTALRYIEDIQKNIRQYRSASTGWQLERRIAQMKLDIRQKLGDPMQVRELAARLFKDSHYTEFKYYDLEKKHYPAEKWSTRVAYYLKETRAKHLGALAGQSPYFEILAREHLFDALREGLLQNAHASTWMAYGEYLKTPYPMDYLHGMQKCVEHMLNDYYTPDYMSIQKCIESMGTAEGGADFVRAWAPRLRLQHSAKRNLAKLLSAYE